MTKRQDYEKIIRETSLSERIDKCREAIGKMCSERRPPKLTIPAQWHDEDIYISTTLMDAKMEIEKLQKFRAAIQDFVLASLAIDCFSISDVEAKYPELVKALEESQ